MQYTIIGGHGKIALLLAPILVEQGHTVRSLIRNPEHAADVAATGATPVELDIENASTDQIATAILGSDAVIFSAGAGGGSPERTYAVDRDAAIRSMDAAKQSDVARYVMVSYLDAGPDHGVDPENSFYAYAEAKAAADEYLRGTDLEWTIVGPGALTLDPASGKIEINPPAETDSREGTSRENVAQVIAAVLADPSSVGKTIGFTDGQTDIAQAVEEA